MRNRIEYIDAIRGFAIVLVVMGHAIAWNYPDWQKVCLFNQDQPVNYMSGGVIWQLIYSFHMPLFFMISGFLSGKSQVSKNNVLEKIWKKIQRLLIPYVVTGSLLYFVRGNWGYWFLLTLFEMSVLWIFISWLINIINIKNSVFIDVVVVCLFYVMFRFGSYIVPQLSYVITGNVLKFFIPFCFGALMQRHKPFLTAVSNSKCYSACLVLFVLLFVTRYVFDYPILYIIVEKLDFYFSLSALFACIMFFHLFMKGIPSKAESIFAYLGRVSLPIYVLHILFVVQLVEIGNFFLSVPPVTSVMLQLIYSFTISVVAIVLCIILYKVLQCSVIVRLLMFGEK